MGLSIRAAYEKIRTPERTVRRGRDPNVPVSIYQEIDGITERLDSLTTLIGGTRDALASVLNPTAANPSSGPTPVLKQTVQLYLPPTGTAGATHSSDYLAVSTKFGFLWATILVDPATTATVVIEYLGSSGDAASVLKAPITGAFKVAGTGYTLPGWLFAGNDPPPGGSYKDLPFKKYDPGSLRFRMTGASPSSRVYGVITVAAYNEV